jgi:hypothetical protein
MLFVVERGGRLFVELA